MITAQDLAGKSLYSSQERARQATSMRRLAGGLRSAAKSNEAAEFTSSEREAVNKAIAVLDVFADALAKASTLRKKAEDARAKRQAQARQAIAGTFAALSTVEDKVALIAVSRPHSLLFNPDRSASDARVLLDSRYSTLNDALDDIVWRIAEASEPVETAAARAWERFQEAAPALRIKHGSLIQQIKEALAADAATTSREKQDAQRA
ncbi:hypothetical protein [Variovorax sp. EL159]|uniref:hypothetical protein n=1 Tax=Variovorax sp. EL159 TaxID=1566270 RepID=UPI000888AA9D|nr:hypothetical protein [Variovorax sp. EL159]SCX72636.1 hypothetical protein SAMN03159363_4358 [Variovorax sp. EL159]